MSKHSKLKAIIQNILSILVVFSFFAIGLVLYLYAANVIPNNNKKGGIITAYVFGSIFEILFILIITKIITILKSENNYKKNAIDLDKLFAETNLTKEQKILEDQFLNTPKEDKESRNIYYSYLQIYVRKTYRRPTFNLVDINLKHQIEAFIIEIKQSYGLFDVYLAIDFTKSLLKKFILRGEYKHYKIYFDTIKKLLVYTNDFVKKELEFSS